MITGCDHVDDCTVVAHPLVKSRIAVLRNRETPAAEFRRALLQVTILVTFEATRELEIEETGIETPLAGCTGHRLRDDVVVVPILRAGLGMAEAILTVLPEARVGHVGIYRDELTLAPVSYYFRAPAGLDRSEVLLVDPMLATGNSAGEAATKLKAGGATRLRLIALLGCVPGAIHFRERHPDVPIFLGALDPGLNERGYIVPGLGDAGDRYFGT